jgi:hypothetical protein
VGKEGRREKMNINNLDQVIELSEIDSNLDIMTLFPLSPSLSIHSVEFLGGAASDVVVLKHGGSDGPTFFIAKSASAADAQGKEFGGIGLRPYLDYSHSTISSGAKLVIILATPAAERLRG